MDGPGATNEGARPRRAAAWVLSGLLGWASVAPAQEDPGAETPVAKHCLRCDNRGLVPCTNHKEKDLEREGVAILCSELAACEDCSGLLEIPCVVCQNPRATKIHRARLAETQTWIGGLRQKEAAWGADPMVHGRSEHFELSWGIPAIKVGNRRLKQHEAMHLYLERLEDEWSYFAEIFEPEPKEFSARHQIFVFPEEEREAFDKASLDLIGRSGGNNNGFKLLGKPSIYTVHDTKKYTGTDEELHRFLVHNAAHMMLANFVNAFFWFGEHRLGWFDEGLASHFEVHRFGFSDNRCHQEVDAGEDWNSQRWKKRVRKLIVTREAPSFLEISQRNIDEVATQDRAFSWLYVEFLLQRDRAAFAKLVRLLKAKKPLREALPEATGLSSIAFDEAFREFANTNFPVR